MKISSKNNNIALRIKSDCRFFSLSSKKLLSINVKNVKNPTNKERKKRIVINKFLFRKDNII